MGDSLTREKLAEAIEAYVDGRIDNDALDKTLSDKDIRRDETCLEIAGEMELFLSDFCYHRNEGGYQISEEAEQAIRRWVYLLRSGWEWPPHREDLTQFGWLGLLALLRSNLCVKSRLAGNCYWPLSGPEEWLAWTKDSDSGDSGDRGQAVNSE